MSSSVISDRSEVNHAPEVQSKVTHSSQTKLNRQSQQSMSQSTHTTRVALTSGDIFGDLMGGGL